MNLLQLLLSGVLVGGVYGLIAMGFVIVYRSSRVFNMAYGQFAVLGAFMAWTFMGSPDSPHLPVPLALMATLVFAVGFGLIIEVVFRRLIGKPPFSGFMLSLGLFALINSAVFIVWGPGTRILSGGIPGGAIQIGAMTLAKEHLITFTVALIAVAAFALFFKKTRLGLAVRASYDNQVAARCLGVSARFVAQIAWCASAVLAAGGGVLLASVQGASTSLADVAMVTLAVVLLGGMDSLVGCVMGGLTLAIAENVATYYMSTSLIGVTGVIPMILILLVLIIRPTGLFGEKPVERV